MGTSVWAIGFSRIDSRLFCTLVVLTFPSEVVLGCERPIGKGTLLFLIFFALDFMTESVSDSSFFFYGVVTLGVIMSEDKTPARLVVLVGGLLCILFSSSFGGEPVEAFLILS